MSRDLARDVHLMHTKFGFNETIRTFDKKKLKKLLDFRVKFQKEEYTELEKAAKEGDFDGVVDALIDTVVVALGTLDCFDVNTDLAWNRVHLANMSKERGVNKTRPNPLGLPDLIKPQGWSPPAHTDNLGLLEKI